MELIIKEKLLENQIKKRLKVAKIAGKHADLIRKVIAHGGTSEKKLDVRLLIRKNLNGTQLIGHKFCR